MGFIDEGRQFNKQLSREEQAIAKSFEGIPFLSEGQKRDALLVWRKLKPGSNFSLEPEISNADLKKIEDIIEKAGLLFKVVEEKKSDEPRKVFFVANNQEDLESLSRLFFGDHLTDPKEYLELGRIYGFPKTAIEAFDKNSQAEKEGSESEFLLILDEMEEKIPKNLRRFTDFLLSKANWQDELKTVRKWADEINLVDPDFYKQLSGL